MNHSAIKSKINSRRCSAGRQECIINIMHRITVLFSRWKLRSRQNHRHFRMDQHRIQCRCTVGTSICSMSNHNSIMVLHSFKCCFCHHSPLFWLHISAIEIQKIDTVDFTQTLKFWNQIQHLLSGRLRFQTVFSFLRSDGSTCRYH